jgi:hypothetical protein
MMLKAFMKMIGRDKEAVEEETFNSCGIMYTTENGVVYTDVIMTDDTPECIDQMSKIIFCLYGSCLFGSTLETINNWLESEGRGETAELLTEAIQKYLVEALSSLGEDEDSEKGDSGEGPLVRPQATLF